MTLIQGAGVIAPSSRNRHVFTPLLGEAAEPVKKFQCRNWRPTRPGGRNRRTLNLGSGIGFGSGARASCSTKLPRWPAKTTRATLKRRPRASGEITSARSTKIAPLPGDAACCGGRRLASAKASSEAWNSCA